MPNLTVNLDEQTLKAAKVYAAQHDTSISRLIRDHLAEVTGLAPRPQREQDVLARFSRGEIGRRETMAALSCDYGTLIGKLEERGLRLPVVPVVEVDAMADTVERLLREEAA